ncbi:TIGR04104 family putative zinc finger protein [Alkalicoccus daliensis]|uniref:Cxxc_20_cxxc protein n=1 Tax=Alkalicoccus daliensis TaxID=745820 RepID=A0A1H0D661_9BACI|nr:TIGR04104 family putative zinc finger protein [Alkalicoccus daliensis]SDN65559.1 cxxc_20_cxxc protein [Alkalicoccus daliensis]
MKLPNCSTCNYSFRWKELFFTFGSKKCPNCGVYQFITAQKRRQSVWVSPIAAAASAIFLQWAGLPFSITIPIVLTVVVLALLLNPFFLEFTEKEEPLF